MRDASLHSGFCHIKVYAMEQCSGLLPKFCPIPRFLLLGIIVSCSKLPTEVSFK